MLSLMTTFYLVRHAHTDWLGKALSGWLPGVHLSEEGRAQAAKLADRFRGMPIAALYSSPLERALETAAPLAQVLGLPVKTADEIGEIDYGEWTGRSLAELRQDPVWEHYNTFRTGTHVPGGETILELQHRMVVWLENLRKEMPTERVAVVSHGDPIKTVVTHYAGLHLDMFHRIEISPASVTAIRVDAGGACMLTLNNLESLAS
jgi:probable phosphoglycerate mutase